tara:strand:+ start:78 stop:284 length:207 start_codon:yes stop_codon:yes gene_type:complete
MEKLEKLIYSVKYLPAILYFGPIVLIGYDIYCNVINETEFLNEYIETPLFFFFLMMTYFVTKNYKKKS